MTRTTPDTQGSYDQCACEPIKSIPFLDTLCTIKAGNIKRDLYRKPTDQNTYLLTNNCHPPEIVSNIPYSLAVRKNQTCSERDTKEKYYKNLKRCYWRGTTRKIL